MSIDQVVFDSLCFFGNSCFLLEPLKTDYLFLQARKEGIKQLTVVTDSAIIVKGMTTWIHVSFISCICV